MLGRVGTRSDLYQPKKASNRSKPEYKAYQKYLKSDKFKEVKSIVHKRDNERCVCCHRESGGKITLQVHHTEYTHLGCGGELEANDCILLCNICHNALSRARGNLSRWSDKSPILTNLKDKKEDNDGTEET